MKIFFLIVFLFVNTGILQAQNPVIVNEGGMCPVMPGEKVKKKFFVDYEGKRMHLCCRPCVRKVKKNPEKYFQEYS